MSEQELGLDDKIILLDLATEFEEYGLDEQFVRDCFERNNRDICGTYMELTAAISTESEIGPYRVGSHLKEYVDPSLVPAAARINRKPQDTDNPPGKQKGRSKDFGQGDDKGGRWNVYEQFPNNMSSYAEVMNGGREDILDQLIPEDFDETNFAELKKKCCDRLIDLHQLTALGAKQVLVRLAADLRSHQNHHIQIITGKGEGRECDPVLGPLVEELCFNIWGLKVSPEEMNKGRYHVYLYDYVPPF